MSVMDDIAEARATAVSLRASAKACTPEQNALKLRLARAASALEGMVLVARRGIERIEQLEQELRQLKAPPADAPSSPVLVNGVDVAPLALAARILHLVTEEVDSELRASVQTACGIVQEVFDDLREASAGGAS